MNKVIFLWGQKMQEHSYNNYHFSQINLGILGSMSVIVITEMLLIGSAIIFHDKLTSLIGITIFILALMIFFSVLIFNYVSSPLEKGISLQESFSCGGQMGSFHASWPFFRLKIYQNGVVLKVLFQVYFIPYESLDVIYHKGLRNFYEGVLIKSRLPGVPERIRLISYRKDKIAELLIKNRDEYLNKKQQGL